MLKVFTYGLVAFNIFVAVVWIINAYLVAREKETNAFIFSILMMFGTLLTIWRLLL